MNGANDAGAAPLVVYVANAQSADISVLRLDLASGRVAPLQRVAAGGCVMPLAISPDRRFLYASIRNEPVAVASFAIDAERGTLSPIGRAALPHSSCWITTDRSGRFLLSASYGASSVAVSPIGSDGSVGAARQVLATEPNAHSIRIDPTNRYAFVASLGGGSVMQLRFDAASGGLTPNRPPSLQPHPNASPRHLAFHPNAPFVYLLNERDASIDVLAFDAAGGTLGVLQRVESWPTGHLGEPWAADIHVTPDGRFVYTCERRTSTLAGFAIDAATGLLAPIGHWPTEAQPRSFAIDPSGRWLLAAGQLSNRLGVHAIDAASGALAPAGGCAVGGDPNWVEVVELRGAGAAAVDA